MPGIKIQKVNLQEALAALPGPWQPQTVATVNEAAVRVAKLQGAFVWHAHPEEDELFLVLSGQLRMQLREQEALVLNPGECVVIPRGVEHCPEADEETHVLLFEPQATTQYGTAKPEPPR